MNTIPSSEFRKTYPKLTDKTAVTVNGHIIGVWLPYSFEMAFPDDAKATPAIRQSRQAAIDTVLRKINKGG